jgi:thioesterase domain-containing protein/acyl carrier protein
VAEKRLARIWEEVLEVNPVGVTDNFFDLGGHSVLATSLFARVEKGFGKRLPLDTLFEAPTVEQLAAILQRDSWTSGGLIQVQAGAASVAPIFLVQARVGYHALAEELGAEQPVYVVPYDNLFVRDPERSLSSVAAELTERIRLRQARGPYYLGGWCLAGRVAFAIARELCRQGEEVALLVIIDISAPGYARLCQLHASRSLIDRLYWHLHYALHGSRRERIDWIAGGFRALCWQAKFRTWQMVRWLFRRIGRSLPRSLRHVNRLTAVAADKEGMMSYPGRITLFRPSEKVSARQGRADLGWGAIATRGVDVHEIPGLKRTLLRAQVAEVGRRLRHCLVSAKQSHIAQT